MTTYEKITFSKITKSFSKTPLLSAVDITLCGGKVILLTGENGSGKTTLLRILAGLLKPDFAQVNFSSAHFRTVNESWKQARNRLLDKVMYLHQRPYMFSGSVSRNLALAVPKSAGKQTSVQIKQALAWGMLTQHASADAKTLSGGQQQRVALARAWLRQSPFMLLDEPIANMDTQSSNRTIKLLHQLKNANTAILICSHHHQIFDALVDQHIELTTHQWIDHNTLSYGGNVSPIKPEKSSDIGG